MLSWITDQAVFDSLYLEARTCVYVDSGRVQTDLKKLTFDDAEVCTRQFAEVLQKLLCWSSDRYYHYMVLDPDPTYYFKRLFGAYPAIQVEVRDSPSSYLSKLAEGPAGNAADAAGTNWMEIVIFPPSTKWFIHALRTEQDNGGHLWIPENLVFKFLEVYPYARVADNC